MKNFQIYNIIKLTFSVLFICCLSLIAKGQCGTPTIGSAGNILPNSATVSFSCSACIPGSQVLEYGLAGFVPGNGAIPGSGGTLITFPTFTTSYTISSLLSSTTYDYYIRLNCGGGIYTPNTVKRSFTTAFQCSSAPVLACGSFVNVTTITGDGAWPLCTSGNAKEKIFSFTPSVSGIHYLVCPFPNAQVYFAYKEAALGCNALNWNCIGLAPTIYMNQLAFGPLTAGTQYYIALDPNSTNIALNANFRIECPYCAPPTNISSTTTAFSITLNWSGVGGFIEYGPQGFTPGSGSSPGSASSSVIFGGSGTTINNLNASTVYDIYIRTSCGGNNFSPNSIKYSIATATCPSASNYSALGTWVYFNFDILPVYPSMNNCSFYAPGGEKRVTFTPPSSGNYNLTVINGNHNFGFGYSISSRIYSPSCNLTGYSNCLSPSFASNTDIYSVGPLVAGTTYEFLFDVQDISPCTQFPCSNSLEFSFSCPTPSNVSISNIQTNQITATWNCNCPVTTFLEYGLSGFTPGTNSNPGVGGTIISGVTSPYNLTGLTTDTKYDIYIRSSCGGNFTANTNVSEFRTGQDCSIAPTITCGNNFSYTVNVSGPQVGGSWQPASCGGSTNAKERMWKFTPTVTGSYNLLIYNFSANSINYQYPIKIFTKNASLPCNEQNWTCAASASFSVQTFSPSLVNIGTLTAGTTYLILVDGVQPTFTAGYSYYFRMECPNLCSSNISPAGNTTFCAGGSVTLNANIGTGLTYQWKKYGNIIAGATSSSFVATGSGVYKVIVTNSSGCSATSSAVNIIVNPLPPATISATGSTAICPGSSVTLNANTGAGLNYQWRKYSNDISGATGATYNATGAGTYKVRVTNANGCSKNSNSIVVTSLTAPVATITATGATTFCAGDSVKLSAASGAGNTYQWRKGSSVINGATGLNYYAKTTGNYKVTVTATNGCTKNSNVIAVNVPCRVGEFAEIPFDIYPNPSAGIFKVVNGENVYATLEIKDVTGKLIFTALLVDQETEIDLTQFPAGIYIAFLKTNNSTQMKKLIIR
jgi:hypothetical protein